MMAPVARQDRISGVGVYRAFRRAHDGSDVRKVDIHFAFELSCLDMLRMAGNLVGESAFAAAAKFQLIHPLFFYWCAESYTTAGHQSLPISIDQSGPDSIL
jgi:hypothetical protein